MLLGGPAATPSRPIKGQEGKRPPPRHQEIAAAARPHDARQVSERHGPVAGWYAMGIGGEPAADQGITLVGKPVERGALGPGLLHEFELPLQVPVQAQEEQARLLPAFRQVRSADTKEAVAVGDVELLARAGVEALARIGTTNVGTIRAFEPLWVLGAEQEVVVRLERGPARGARVIGGPRRRRLARRPRTG